MLSVLPEPMWHLVQGFVFDAGPNIWQSLSFIVVLQDWTHAAVEDRSKAHSRRK